MLDYDSIKVMAKSIGRSVRDLIALSPGNDPFYANTGARRQAAEWFAGVWANYGGAGFHLRRLHYRLASANTPIRKPDGGAYQNTEGDWKLLATASLSARYLDLVPFDGLVDRRNDLPLIFAEDLDVDPDKEIDVSCSVRNYGPGVDLDIPEMPPLPFLSIDTGDSVQKYITEVWVEKSTQNDWLLPLCERRGVNLVIGIGEQSETRSRELALRAAQYGAPVRVIYLADFDPGGRSMPKAVVRKVEFTIAKFGLDVDLQLIPLALTPDQCRQYRLPRTPIKETERRKDRCENIFGIGATELDAVEALYPGELARLLDTELDNWLDAGLARRARIFKSELDVILGRISATCSQTMRCDRGDRVALPRDHLQSQGGRIRV